MRVAEVAIKTGLSAPTIRFYEQLGILDQRHVKRSANGYRDYNETTLDQLSVIKEVQSAGFSLTEFKKLDLPCAQGTLLADQARQVIEQKIAQTTQKVTELQGVLAFLLTKLEELNCPPS